jgi:hypothetical protein
MTARPQRVNPKEQQNVQERQMQFGIAIPTAAEFRHTIREPEYDIYENQKGANPHELLPHCAGIRVGYRSSGEIKWQGSPD